MGILNFAVQAVRLGIFMLFLLMAAWQDFKTKEINVRLFWIFGVAGLGLCCLSGVETAADVLASAQSQRLLPGALGEYISIVSVRAAARAGAVSFFQIRRRNW